MTKIKTNLRSYCIIEENISYLKELISSFSDGTKGIDKLDEISSLLQIRTSASPDLEGYCNRVTSVNERKGRSQMVREVITNKVYPSAKEASKITGFSLQAIYYQVRVLSQYDHLKKDFYFRKNERYYFLRHPRKKDHLLKAKIESGKQTCLFCYYEEIDKSLVS